MSLSEEMLATVPEITWSVSRVQVTIQRWAKRVAALETALTLIGDLGYDYDGCREVESLKNLIDEMVKYARNPQLAVDAMSGGEDEHSGVS